MFCRDDILAELNLEAPKTWDDLMSMVPVLQFNNMDIGLASDLRTYMFQMNGEYWSDEGMSTGFDKTGTLTKGVFEVNGVFAACNIRRGQPIQDRRNAADHHPVQLL